eukprot:Hpha_TRINITY_DN16796_c7_g1::TRINITY_DN16796_c7_g1_i1::g.80076::m.80076
MAGTQQKKKCEAASVIAAVVVAAVEVMVGSENDKLLAAVMSRFADRSAKCERKSKVSTWVPDTTDPDLSPGGPQNAQANITTSGQATDTSLTGTVESNNEQANKEKADKAQADRRPIVPFIEFIDARRHPNPFLCHSTPEMVARQIADVLFPEEKAERDKQQKKEPLNDFKEIKARNTEIELLKRKWANKKPVSVIPVVIGSVPGVDTPIWEITREKEEDDGTGMGETQVSQVLSLQNAQSAILMEKAGNETEGETKGPGTQATIRFRMDSQDAIAMDRFWSPPGPSSWYRSFSEHDVKVKKEVTLKFCDGQPHVRVHRGTGRFNTWTLKVDWVRKPDQVGENDTYEVIKIDKTGIVTIKKKEAFPPTPMANEEERTAQYRTRLQSTSRASFVDQPQICLPTSPNSPRSLNVSAITPTVSHQRSDAATQSPARRKRSKPTPKKRAPEKPEQTGEFTFWNPPRALPDGYNPVFHELQSVRELRSRVYAALRAVGDAVSEERAILISDIGMCSEGGIQELMKEPGPEKQIALMRYAKSGTTWLHDYLNRKSTQAIVVPITLYSLRAIDVFLQIIGDNRRDIVFVVIDNPDQARVQMGELTRRLAHELHTLEQVRQKIKAMEPLKRITSCFGRRSATVVPNDGGEGQLRVAKRLHGNAIAVCAGGGFPALTVLSGFAGNNVPMILLAGSGRLIEVLDELWIDRSDSTLDVSAMIEVLRRRGVVPNHGPRWGVETGFVNLEILLSKGEVFFSPITKRVLEDLCSTHLRGKDPMMTEVEQRVAQYEEARRAYKLWSMPLEFLSIIFSLGATVLAMFTYMFADSGSTLYWVALVLPGLLVIIDELNSFLYCGARARAAERAAGLATKEKFCYAMCVGKYADRAIADAAGSKDMDLDSMRRVLLGKSLHDIDRALADMQVNYGQGPSYGCLQCFGWFNAKVFGLFVPKLEWDIALGDSGDGVRWTGEEYKKNRLTAAKRRVAKWSAITMMGTIVIKVLLLVSASVGTVLASLGEGKWLAVSVASTTAINRLSKEFRVNEQRQAYSKAGALLNVAELDWFALPNEKKHAHHSIEHFVVRVEDALESVLPSQESKPTREEAQEDKKGHKKK